MGKSIWRLRAEYLARENDQLRKALKIYLDEKSLEALRVAAADTDTNGTWCPWHGVKGLATKMAEAGLLKPAGINAMRACPVYVITDAGRAALPAGKRDGT